MNYTEFESILLEEFPFVTDLQREQFARLDGLYRDWNAKINVISRKDIDELYLHHVLHSLCIASFAKRSASEAAAAGSAFGAPGSKVLDLGTGGGFPGIPLAIMFPEAEFTLCDSIGKKIRVAGEVASALGLKNVRTVNARVESLAESFDWTVSRAVCSLEDLIPLVKGKCGKGLLCLKGGNIAGEIEDAMRRWKLPMGSVSTWAVDNWLKDSHFAGKFVLLVDYERKILPV